MSEQKCLCITCTCTGCKEKCFGHCQSCGEPVTDCNSYQTGGDKHVPAKSADLPANETPAFDYTGLSEQTVTTLHSAENIIRTARKEYIVRVADAVGMVHDELCNTAVRNLENGQFSPKEETFRAWCASVGLSKSTAYNLLQVSNLLAASTPLEQKVLEQAQPSLLYAAAKPSAPAEAVAAVKTGDVTTHKEYQALVKKLKSAEQRAHDAETGKTMAQQSLNQALYERSTAQNLLQNTKSRLEKTQDELSAAQSELAALKNRPIEVAVEKPDPAEIDRLAREKAEALSAGLRAQMQALSEECDTLRRAADSAPASAPDPGEDYNTLLLAVRALNNLWQSAVIPLQRLPLQLRADVRAQLDEAVDRIAIGICTLCPYGTEAGA